jgi:hypothetical protein
MRFSRRQAIQALAGWLLGWSSLAASAQQLLVQPQAHLAWERGDTYAIDIQVDYKNTTLDTIWLFQIWDLDDSPESKALQEAGETVNSFRLDATLLQTNGRRSLIYLDLSNQRSWANNGHLFDSLLRVAIPPCQSKRMHYPLVIYGRKMTRLRKATCRFFGEYYTNMPDTVERMRRWSNGNVYLLHCSHSTAFDLQMHHKAGHLTHVKCQVRPKPTRTVWSTSFALDDLEYRLKKWEGCSPWRFSRQGDFLILTFHQKVHWCSSLSGSLSHPYQIDPDESDYQMVMRLVPRQSDRKWKSMKDPNGRLKRFVSDRIRRGEPKTNWLDTENQKLQQKILRNYQPQSTHRFDEHWDLLIFDNYPADIDGPEPGSAVIPARKALLEFMATRYPNHFRKDYLPYIGVVGREWLKASQAE